MDQQNAMEFYKKVVEGTDHSRTISLETKDGTVLEGVKMAPVDKKTLAAVIERLPDEMFEVPEDIDQDELKDMDPEDLEEQTGGNATSAVTEDSVAGFEELCIKSLSHDDLVDRKMANIIANLSFEVLFELGSEVMDFSIEQTGDVKDFHVQE